MKKLLCFALCLVLLAALLAGCDPAQQEPTGTTAPTTVPTQPTDPAPTDPEPDDPKPAPTDPELTDPTEPSQGTESAEPRNLNFTYQCIDTWPCLDSTCGEPELYVIDSPAALEAYCLEQASHVDGTGFADTIAAYNEDYFSEHTLIIVALEDGCQPIYFEVCEVVIQSDGTGVLYLKKMIPKLVNLGSAGWHILVDVEGKIPQDTQFALEIEKTILD